MGIENIVKLIDELIEFVKPVGSLVSDFFDYMYMNIPVSKQVFLIASGLAVISIGLYLFIKMVAS